MLKKICTICKIEKDISQFYVSKNKIESQCKQCKSEYSSSANVKTRRRKNYKKNKISILQKNKESYPKNKNKILLRSKKYAEKNKQKILEYQKKYREQNKELIKIKQKKYRLENHEKLKQNQKTYYKKNKEKLNKSSRDYFQNNKEKINEYNKKRRESNLTVKIAVKLRSRLRSYIVNKNINKTFQSHINFLGCSVPELRVYLEEKFQDGMSWDNYNFKGWHIDHILPLSSFDLTDPEQVKKACHYTNLQPLWAEDNFKKGDKIL